MNKAAGKFSKRGHLTRGRPLTEGVSLFQMPSKLTYRGLTTEVIV
jgi:hypothetical protein